MIDLPPRHDHFVRRASVKIYADVMTSGYRMDLDYRAIGGNELQGWELGH